MTTTRISTPYVDEVNDQVRIFDLAYRPSAVLFALDQEGSRDLLAVYEPSDVDGPEGVAPESSGSAP